MTILLLGKDGQVGHEIQRSLDPLGDVVAAGRGRVDLTQPDAIRTALNEADPDVVVNAAAYTAVDDAEDEPDRARQVNAEAPRVLAEEARQRGAWLVHYSTDYVFDGTARRPYREDDRAVPLNVYGQTKWEGEEAVRAAGGKHIILRTSWVYSARRSNFLLTMLRLAEECRQGERDRLTVVDDQTGCPTSARWIAGATATLVRTVLDCEDASLAGTYHLSSTGQTTWYGFAEAIFAQFGFEDVTVEPVSTDAYPTPATRPKYTVLDTRRVQSVFGVEIPTWTQQLARLRAEQAEAEAGS